MEASSTTLRSVRALGSGRELDRQVGNGTKSLSDRDWAEGRLEAEAASLASPHAEDKLPTPLHSEVRQGVESSGMTGHWQGLSGKP